MSSILTDTLCTRCGLCCDGTLFADVELASRAEATKLEAMGLEIEDDDAGGALLVQPCAALHARRCRIYTHRPECCRTFECRLLRDVRRGAIAVEQAREQIAEALKRVGQVRELTEQLGRRRKHLPLGESCAEALARDAGPEAKRMQVELESSMASLEGLIRRTFLGP